MFSISFIIHAIAYFLVALNQVFDFSAFLKIGCLTAFLSCLYVSIRRLDRDFIQHILTFKKTERLKKILKLAFVLRAFFQLGEFEHTFQGFTKIGKEDKA